MPTLLKPIKKKSNIKYKERQEIYSSRRWKNLRKAKLQQSPLCQICQQKGLITPADEIHHIDSFMNYKGLERLEKAYNFNNLLSICKICHLQIHNNK